MPTVEKITIALTKEIAENVRNAVTAGEYASTSEVIREALRDWQFKRDPARSGRAPPPLVAGRLGERLRRTP